MPELPEVEVVKNFLKSNFQKKKIIKVKIINKNLRFEIQSIIKTKLTNLIITKIYRRGKYLILLLENNFSLMIHLGMTGYFRMTNEDNRKKHDHLIFYFCSEVLIFNDVRKFGFIKFYNFEELNDSKHLKDMGPEPFSDGFNLNYFTKKIKRKCSVKNLLMNQKFVAGLGNIYCSEILFDAGVSPERICNELSKKQIEKIIISTRRILDQAITSGGTTIKNFIVNNEKIGYFKNKLKVYGKENQSCPRCKSLAKIQRIKQSGRSTFLCAKCQN